MGIKCAYGHNADVGIKSGYWGGNVDIGLKRGYGDKSRIWG